MPITVVLKSLGKALNLTLHLIVDYRVILHSF